MPNGRFAYAHLLNTRLTPLRRLFLDRSPPHFLSAAAPRRFEAGVCKQTSGGHLPSFRAAPRIPACASSRSCRHYYVGPREKEQFIAYLDRRLGDKRLQGLVKSLFRPSYGGNRNYTLIYTLGGLIVSADDDMRPDALM